MEKRRKVEDRKYDQNKRTEKEEREREMKIDHSELSSYKTLEQYDYCKINGTIKVQYLSIYADNTI